MTIKGVFSLLVAIFVAVLIFYGLAAAVNNGDFNTLNTYGWIGFWLWMGLGALVGLRIGIEIAQDED